MRDSVYSNDKGQIVDFAFTQEVVDVFPDMIRRSVMGYETMVPVTGLIAARHLGLAGHAYDLGCSLGATTLAILSQNDSEDIRVTGVDNSTAMIKGAQAAVFDKRAHFVEQDIRATDVSGANVIVLNLVLQFIDPVDRIPLLKGFRQQMHPQGILIVSEKVRHDDSRLHTLFNDTHLAWKKANGYSDLEISQKRSAIENVMKIDTEEMHQDRFAKAGFTDAHQWYRCMNWASFIVQP